ncbi:hypothetical protein PYW07_002138 [Mythimna separata]|uniref:DUF4780 domain-containing protein n=1 Tax=Mythimna separata TaxID=271217 RepID=A0AAD7YMX4_MYTSE|nr:hypothetical protein PYW07_002138 [Mythimna separata]
MIPMPKSLPPFYPYIPSVLRKGNLESPKAHQNSTNMKQSSKITTQVGPGQAGESHADSSVSPHRILGGGTNLLIGAASSARPSAETAHPIPAQATLHAPDANTLTPAATHAMNTRLTLSAPSSAWHQSMVRKSVTNNPDNDTDKAHLASLGKELRALARQRRKTEARLRYTNPEHDSERAYDSSGPTPIRADEVRMLVTKHEKICARERELSDRMRKIRESFGRRDTQTAATPGVRDQPEVREGATRSEKRSDAGTGGVCDQPEVRDGETRTEKGPDAERREQGTTRAGSLNQNLIDAQNNKTRRKRARRPRPLRVPVERATPGTSEPQPGPSGLGLVKRMRPDDTASPSELQEDRKRARTETAPREQKTYAQTTNDTPEHLAVAICFSPFSRDITRNEATRVKVELDRLLMESDLALLPAFRGYPRLRDGALQMWCEDENALTWLTQNVPLIRLPNTDLTLTVVLQSDVPPRVRAALYVPRYNGPIERLQHLLARQNPWYNIGRWSLYRATSVGGSNHGTYLTLGIPVEELDTIRGRERRIAYSLGSIYVRFYRRSNPKGISNEPSTFHADVSRLEEEMAHAAMNDILENAPASPRWPAQLLATSPSNDESGTEEGGELSEGSFSS